MPVPTSPPIIPALYTPVPQRTQDANTFSANADAFVDSMPPFGTGANSLGAWMNTTASGVYSDAAAAAGSATAAAGSATAAAASAATAINAPGTTATSSTSLSIATGSKSLTLDQTGKAFAVGMFVQISQSPGVWMNGEITAFNPGTGSMTVLVGTTSGSGGPFTAWNISLSAPIKSAARNVVIVSSGSTFSALPYVDYVFKVGATATLPTSPGTGDPITVKNATGSAGGPVLDPGSNKIDGKSGPLVWDRYNLPLTLVWSGDSAIGWYTL